ncbi:hypothetical protein PS6_003670 [Mucor atramentarius]
MAIVSSFFDQVHPLSRVVSATTTPATSTATTVSATTTPTAATTSVNTTTQRSPVTILSANSRLSKPTSHSRNNIRTNNSMNSNKINSRPSSIGGQASSPRILDSRGSNLIDQLARIESSLSGATDISVYDELDYTGQNGQYDESVVYQQARWHPVSPTNEPCNRSVELVPEAQHSDPSTTHTECLEHSSGSGISSTILQESMADQAGNQQLVEPNVCM